MAIGVWRDFPKVIRWFFTAGFVMGLEWMKSLHAIWNRAFSQFDRVSSIAFLFVRALAVVQSKIQLSPIRGRPENSFFESTQNRQGLAVGMAGRRRSEAAYTALTGHHSTGFFCQAMIAGSRHPTRPGEIRTGLGNRPSFMARQRVECERDVTSMTSLSLMKRSSLLTLGSYDLSLCETP